MIKHVLFLHDIINVIHDCVWMGHSKENVQRRTKWLRFTWISHLSGCVPVQTCWCSSPCTCWCDCLMWTDPSTRLPGIYTRVSLSGAGASWPVLLRHRSAGPATHQGLTITRHTETFQWYCIRLQGTVFHKKHKHISSNFVKLKGSIIARSYCGHSSQIPVQCFYMDMVAQGFWDSPVKISWFSLSGFGPESIWIIIKCYFLVFKS